MKKEMTGWQWHQYAKIANHVYLAADR